MRKIIEEGQVQDVFNAKTLAPYLNVSERMVHHYRTKGHIKSVRSSRGRYLFMKDDVIEFMVKELGYERA